MYVKFLFIIYKSNANEKNETFYNYQIGKYLNDW